MCGALLRSLFWSVRHETIYPEFSSFGNDSFTISTGASKILSKSYIQEIEMEKDRRDLEDSTEEWLKNREIRRKSIEKESDITKEIYKSRSETQALLKKVKEDALKKERLIIKQNYRKEMELKRAQEERERLKKLEIQRMKRQQILEERKRKNELKALEEKKRENEWKRQREIATIRNKEEARKRNERARNIRLQRTPRKNERMTPRTTPRSGNKTVSRSLYNTGCESIQV